MSNQIVPVSATNALMPVMNIEMAITRYNEVMEFTKRVMKDGKDYGIIPGTGDKPTLLKPGAEKLCSLFGLSPEFVTIDKIVDFTAGLFYFELRCDLYHNGVKVGSGIGSCNSKEKKYRYRQSERVCPNCNKPTIIKGKQEYGGGWLCFAKKGGCGAKFPDGNQSIEGQQMGQVENTEPFDLVNTINKMAQKRALIAAVLIAANASEFYTQDVEDMEYIDGEFTTTAEPPTKQVTQQRPTPKPSSPPKSNGNSKSIPELLVDAGICENIPAAASLLNKHIPNDVKTDPEKVVAWGHLYRGWRDSGADVETAAKNATDGIALP